MNFLNKLITPSLIKKAVPSVVSMCLQKMAGYSAVKLSMREGSVCAFGLMEVNGKKVAKGIPDFFDIGLPGIKLGSILSAKLSGAFTSEKDFIILTCSNVEGGVWYQSFQEGKPGACGELLEFIESAISDGNPADIANAAKDIMPGA